ncbi:hypothetical protein [Enterobacter quasiroggenkampii]|uniref:hypothetical protein n=1 Tax=Enterobacter quasiroggenkampii TaxID=2497436 RepID=UPI000B1A74B4
MSNKYEDLIKNVRMNADCGEHMSPAEVTTLLNVVETTFAALAAENAGLKAMCEDRRTFIINGVQLGYIQVPTVETDPALETIRVAVSPQEPTPATDAFLAEVRAQGLERLAKAWYAIANETATGISISESSRLKYRQRADDVADFANEIRKEAAQ